MYVDEVFLGGHGGEVRVQRELEDAMHGREIWCRDRQLQRPSYVLSGLSAGLALLAYCGMDPAVIRPLGPTRACLVTAARSTPRNLQTVSQWRQLRDLGRTFLSPGRPSGGNNLKANRSYLQICSSFHHLHPPLLHTAAATWRSVRVLHMIIIQPLLYSYLELPQPLPNPRF
jgi:hypothetical protein